MLSEENINHKKISENLSWSIQVQGGRRVPGGVPDHVHGLQPDLLAALPALWQGRVTYRGRGGASG